MRPFPRSQGKAAWEAAICFKWYCTLGLFPQVGCFHPVTAPPPISCYIQAFPKRDPSSVNQRWLFASLHSIQHRGCEGGMTERRVTLLTDVCLLKILFSRKWTFIKRNFSVKHYQLFTFWEFNSHKFFTFFLTFSWKKVLRCCPSYNTGHAKMNPPFLSERHVLNLKKLT